MLKKNKELLRKIYQQEYEKAIRQENKAKLERDIARVKEMARNRAKRKAEGFNLNKQLNRGKKLQKNARPVGKKLKRMGDNMTRMNQELFGL
jgi:hypothetical protein